MCVCVCVCDNCLNDGRQCWLNESSTWLNRNRPAKMLRPCGHRPWSTKRLVNQPRSQDSHNECNGLDGLESKSNQIKSNQI